MKYIYITTLFFLVSISLIAQTDAEDGILIGNHYITKADILLAEWNMTGASSFEDSNKIAKSGAIFTIHKIKDSSLIIKFWMFSKKSSTKKNWCQSNDSSELAKDSVPPTDNCSSNKYIGYHTNEKYFVIDIKSLNTYATPYNGRSNNFTWGLILFPTKIRFANGSGGSFNFTDNFTLGTTAGYEIGFAGVKNYSLSILGGVGISAINVDSSTTHGYVKNSITASAFTVSAGVVYSYEKMQIGLFYGWDFMSGNLGNKWVYDAKPWLSVGIGFALFQKEKTSSKDAGKN